MIAITECFTLAAWYMTGRWSRARDILAHHSVNYPDNGSIRVSPSATILGQWRRALAYISTKARPWPLAHAT